MVLPAENLQVVVITRLPFASPTDPVFSARGEVYGDPFNGYSVPEAILRFRQGFGRLPHVPGHRGVVVILDRRILSKNYGQTFLDSVPACTIKKAPLAELGNTVRDWVNPAEPIAQIKTHE